MEEVMTVLIAHYSDDWQSESEGTKVFANTAAGAVAAINWIDDCLPCIETELSQELLLV